MKLSSLEKKFDKHKKPMRKFIKHLEESFGVQLFIRHHAQGVSLTPSGSRFYRKALELLRVAHEFEQNALADDSHPYLPDLARLMYDTALSGIARIGLDERSFDPLKRPVRPYVVRRPRDLNAP